MQKLELHSIITRHSGLESKVFKGVYSTLHTAAQLQDYYMDTISSTSTDNTDVKHKEDVDQGWRETKEDNTKAPFSAPC
jgi:hypothetical protein